MRDNKKIITKTYKPEASTNLPEQNYTMSFQFPQIFFM